MARCRGGSHWPLVLCSLRARRSRCSVCCGSVWAPMLSPGRHRPCVCVGVGGGVRTCGAARLWGRSGEGLGLGGAGRPSSQLVERPGASVVGTRPTGQGQPTGLGARGGLRCPWATWEATGDLTTSASTDCGRWLGWTAHAWREESEEGPAPGGRAAGGGGEGRGAVEDPCSQVRRRGVSGSHAPPAPLPPRPGQTPRPPPLSAHRKFSWGS